MCKGNDHVEHSKVLRCSLPLSHHAQVLAAQNAADAGSESYSHVGVDTRQASDCAVHGVADISGLVMATTRRVLAKSPHVLVNREAAVSAKNQNGILRRTIS